MGKILDSSGFTILLKIRIVGGVEMILIELTWKFLNLTGKTEKLLFLSDPRFFNLLKQEKMMGVTKTKDER